MANKKITELQLKASATDDCNFPVDDGLQTYRLTLAQVLTYIRTAVTFITSALEDLSPDPAADYVLTYDASAAANKKVKITNLSKMAVVAKVAAYTATILDDLILGSTSAFTITLPAASTCSGKVLTFKKTDSSVTNIITIDGAGSETIDGALTYPITMQYETISIVSDGSNWHII